MTLIILSCLPQSKKVTERMGTELGESWSVLITSSVCWLSVDRIKVHTFVRAREFNEMN